jgi:hypothetical protein
LIDHSAFLFRKLFLKVVFSIKRTHIPNRENTIAIFSQPRSGSTWLSQLLAEIPKTIKVDEPLFRGKFSLDGKMPPRGRGKLDVLDDLNFFYYQPIPLGAEFPEAEEFFKRLFELDFTNPYLFEETNLLKIPGSENVLFKFCYGSLLLPWLSNKIKFSPIVLVRNPFAVVSSQLSHYSFQEILNQHSYQLPTFRFDETFTRHEAILATIKYPEEILAATWCINYLKVVEKECVSKDWLIVSYENIVSNPDSEIQRIFEYLNKPIPNSIWNHFYKPTISTSKTDFESKHQLSSWKEKLNKDQIQRITQILLKFKIEGYSDEIYPNNSVIYN